MMSKYGDISCITPQFRRHLQTAVDALGSMSNLSGASGRNYIDAQAEIYDFLELVKTCEQ